MNKPPPASRSGPPLRVVLLANYLPDALESMNRFASMMQSALEEAGVETSVVRPASNLCRRNAHRGLSKWLAYIDKFLFFPATTLRRLPAGGRSVVHICDHSNAVYLRFLRRHATLVTCHDVIPIQSALGMDVDCPVSGFGRHLQFDILRGLGMAGRVACVSEATRAALLPLLPALAGRSSVVHSSLNAPFSPLGRAASLEILARRGEPPRPPFLLHVGSNLPRKNRPLLLRLLKALGSTPYTLVLAGKPMDDTLRQLAGEIGVASQIVDCAHPSHEELQALYSTCHALVFPSTQEGFGWPVIEAQACGAPVVCAEATSLPEVAGKGAALCDPNDESQYALAVRRLEDPSFRASMVQEGFANLLRFSADSMAQGYLNLYQTLLN
jgi:glycosyltransferase involved in cell wall biosynthesis